MTWDDAAGVFARAAADLQVGHQLRVADDSVATIQSVLNYHTDAQTAYNLTVDQLHTYYVLAGTTPVLVHNDGGAPPGVWTVDPGRSTKVMRGGPFGANYYQQAQDANGDVYWWSPDKAGHGGSAWKVFRETSTGLDWVADAGSDGTFIEGKFKGKTGKFIS